MLKATGERKKRGRETKRAKKKARMGSNLRGGEEKKRLLGQATARQLGPAAQVFAVDGYVCWCFPAIVPFVSGGRWGIAAADLAWPTAKRPQRALATAVHGAKAAQGAKIAAKLELLGIS